MSKKHWEKTWRDAKRCAPARMTMRGRISAVQPSTKRWTVAPKCCRVRLFHGFSTLGIQPVTQHEKTLESYVFADNEEMITSVMNMQNMSEIFSSKSAWGFGWRAVINLGIWTTMILTNKHFLSLSHLSIYSPSWSGRELFEHPRILLENNVQLNSHF